MNQQERQRLQDIRLESVKRKIARYVEARRIAEEAFDKLKESPEWGELCERHGIYPGSDFGDWTC